MPKLQNNHGNIILELDLFNNELFDVKKGRASFENWIPFVFSLLVEDNEKYSYSSRSGATFSMEDINLLITQLELVINRKSNKEELERLSWGPIENYFSLDFYETYEDNEIYIELWIMVGLLTKGKSFGYKRGFQFVVKLDSLEKFIIEFKEQLSTLLANVYPFSKSGQ